MELKYKEIGKLFDIKNTDATYEKVINKGEWL